MIKWLFGVPPKIGSSWRLIGTCPFVDTYTEVVDDVIEGWVKYHHIWDKYNPFYSYRSVREFRSLYKEIKNGKTSKT